MTNLEQSILATISYFDIFEYPLTLQEIRKNLLTLNSNDNWENNPPLNPLPRGDFTRIPLLGGVRGGLLPSLTDIQEAINNEKLKKKISKKNGFYFLTGKERHYFTRQQRYYITEKKFKRAKRVCWLLSKIPYIKMIATCNSLGFNNATKASDIDLFIITSKNRIWTTRLLSVGLIKFLNLRPKPNKTEDTICLSFFVDEDNVDLEKFKISPLTGGARGGNFDIYLTYWTAQLVPIFDKEKTHEKFWQTNQWLDKHLPNRIHYQTGKRRKIELKQKTTKSYKNNLIEKLAKLQLKLMNGNLKEMMNKDTRVVVNDGVLKLYPLDRRAEYLKLWQEKLATNYK